MPPPIGAYGEGAEAMNGLEWTGMFPAGAVYAAVQRGRRSGHVGALASHPQTGLPIGMQFAAGFAREDVLLRLAGQLERARRVGARGRPVWAGRTAQ
ncbi:hypothetical protein [Burkholderia plantarii]|uniref:hypothetical protein n=1 Tax=Burkholderia plantarii TaxID=41899 RepID=UPI001F5B6CBA|nr:hypothetical protein [Burkholderia plantarii]